jgi:diguanylate cyclase (GGDEF)-like protein
MRNILSQALTILARLRSTVADDALHFELVKALYGTPVSMISAIVVSVAIVAIAWNLSGDRTYAVFLAAFALVGIGRIANLSRFRHEYHRPRDVSSTRLWENRALIGAWIFAALVGFLGAYTIARHAGSDTEILVSCSVFGYIAGISSRNASRPIITIGQISFTCLPFLLAMVARSDLVHLGLAALITALYASTVVTCSIVFDTIEARHIAFKRIEILARRDALTGLWNRSSLFEFLDQNLAPTSPGTSALIAIDLDRFKDINDTLGHPAGDLVLKTAAERIASVVDAKGRVSRIGGDEFLVLLPGADDERARTVAEDVITSLSEPFPFTVNSRSLGASIGFVLAPRDGITGEGLIRNADLALYEAKRQGRNQIVAYSPALTAVHDNRVALETDLFTALQNGELEVVYQPIVDSRTGQTLCCEALLRWRHPIRGTIPPHSFIPIAEVTGTIHSIGAFVLNEACAEAMQWSDGIRLAVNLSPVQFKRGPEFIDIVMQALGRSGLPPQRLDLEVTESVLMEESEATRAVVEGLRRARIGVALDDFGTGFASLAYLNDFPFSKIKIDRRFSQNVDQSPRTAAIIRGIVEISRELRIELIAEGVEKDAQLRFMNRLGIFAIQGYLFSRPLPAAQLRSLIAKPIFPLETGLTQAFGASRGA